MLAMIHSGLKTILDSVVDRGGNPYTFVRKVELENFATRNESLPLNNTMLFFKDTPLDKQPSPTTSMLPTLISTPSNSE